MKIDSAGFILQDVLLLLGVSARTGELVLESGNNIGTVLFYQGAIIQAFSPYSHAFGDLLVEDGLISEEELINTLLLQKKNSYAPIGGLLLKAGKVTIEIIERKVSEQIRHAVREFETWTALNVTFVDKDIKPYDRIRVPVHEFIDPETMRSVALFLTVEKPFKELPLPPSISSCA